MLQQRVLVGVGHGYPTLVRPLMELVCFSTRKHQIKADASGRGSIRGVAPPRYNGWHPDGSTKRTSLWSGPQTNGIEDPVIGDVVEETYYPGFCCKEHSGGRVF